MPPERLASLTCSNTDILHALDLCRQVVAVDSYSDAPGLEHAARLGPDLNIDVPALIRAGPDLVLASLSVPGMERIVAQVQAAGLRTAALDPLSVTQTLETIREIGLLTGHPQRGAAVAAALARDLGALRRPGTRVAGAAAAAPRVLVEWWPRPIIAATRDSWVTELLDSLGAVNALADRPGRSSPLTLDEVRAAAPDLIVCSWCGARRLRPEVIEARGLGVPVVAVHESGLGRPGPRLIEGARQIRAALDRLSLNRLSLTAAHPPDSMGCV